MYILTLYRNTGYVNRNMSLYNIYKVLMLFSKEWQLLVNLINFVRHFLDYEADTTSLKHDTIFNGMLTSLHPLGKILHLLRKKIYKFNSKKCLRYVSTQATEYRLVTADGDIL